MRDAVPDLGRKYRALAPELLARVWREACAIEPREADALKRAKRALHQLHSAFVQERALDAAERVLDKLPIGAGSEASSDAVMNACRAILGCHASTRERLATIEPLHAELRARIGTLGSVLDLGCGLHPFALPWMKLARDVPYHAREADGRMAGLIARLFERLGQIGSVATIDLVEPEAGRPAAIAADLPRADVALLFKLLPTLERQRAGSGERLLGRLDVRAAVLSFPTRSLGARSKGMGEQYRRFAAELLPPRAWSTESFELGAEWFVIARPRTQPAAGVRI